MKQFMTELKPRKSSVCGWWWWYLMFKSNASAQNSEGRKESMPAQLLPTKQINKSQFKETKVAFMGTVVFLFRAELKLNQSMFFI